MNTPTLKTTRLILRRFTEKDIKALFLILKDIEVNKFLPWYPLKDIEEAKLFYEENMLQNIPFLRDICMLFALKKTIFP